MRLQRLLGLLVLGLGALAPAQAQVSASGSVSGSIKVIQPIAIRVNKSLAFGTITKGAGTVTVSNAGVLSAGGGTAQVASSTVSQGQVSITGEGAQQISVTVPASFNLTSGANTLTVSTTKPHVRQRQRPDP